MPATADRTKSFFAPFVEPAEQGGNRIVELGKKLIKALNTPLYTPKKTWIVSINKDYAHFYVRGYFRRLIPLAYSITSSLEDEDEVIIWNEHPRVQRSAVNNIKNYRYNSKPEASHLFISKISVFLHHGQEMGYYNRLIVAAPELMLDSLKDRLSSVVKKSIVLEIDTHLPEIDLNLINQQLVQIKNA